jgi:hypothetical protein
MNTTELINGILRTREEMAIATRRDCNAIYRRLLPQHQTAWDELIIPNFWLNADVKALRERVAKAAGVPTPSMPRSARPAGSRWQRRKPERGEHEL